MNSTLIYRNSTSGKSCYTALNPTTPNAKVPPLPDPAIKVGRDLPVGAFCPIDVIPRFRGFIGGLTLGQFGLSENVKGCGREGLWGEGGERWGREGHMYATRNFFPSKGRCGWQPCSHCGETLGALSVALGESSWAPTALSALSRL